MDKNWASLSHDVLSAIQGLEDELAKAKKHALDAVSKAARNEDCETELLAACRAFVPVSDSLPEKPHKKNTGKPRFGLVLDTSKGIFEFVASKCSPEAHVVSEILSR